MVRIHSCAIIIPRHAHSCLSTTLWHLNSGSGTALSLACMIYIPSIHKLWGMSRLLERSQSRSTMVSAVQRDAGNPCKWKAGMASMACTWTLEVMSRFRTKNAWMLATDDGHVSGLGMIRLPMGAKCGKVTCCGLWVQHSKSGIARPFRTILQGKVSRGAIAPDQWVESA